MKNERFPYKAAIFHLILLVLLALDMSISVAFAAEPAVHKLGVRVRASVKGLSRNPTRNKEINGMLVGLDERDIILATSRNGHEVILPWSNVAGLELSLRGSQRRKGALIGTGVGLVGGALLGAASTDGFLITDEESAGILGLLFAPIGTLTGMLAAPGERWQPVPTENIQLDPCNGLLGGRVRVSMAATFPVIANTEIVTGELAGLSATAFTLNMSNSGLPTELSRQNITKLELSLQSGQRVKGALIGLGIGFATGALIGLAAGEGGNATIGEKTGLGGLVLGSAGTILGIALSPGEWWHPIPLERIHP